MVSGLCIGHTGLTITAEKHSDAFGTVRVDGLSGMPASLTATECGGTGLVGTHVGISCVSFSGCAGIAVAEEPSNEDDSYARVRIGKGACRINEFGL